MAQRSLFEAKCTSCGQATTVPFKPSPNKPVYCRTCFSKRLANPVPSPTCIYNFNPKQAWSRRR